IAPLSSLLAPPRNGRATYYRAERLDESVMAASSLATKSLRTGRPLIQRTTVTISFLNLYNSIHSGRSETTEEPLRPLYEKIGWRDKVDMDSVQRGNGESRISFHSGRSA